MDVKTKIDCAIQSRIGGRSENQDYAGFSETPIGTVVVVCDGMGGMSGGSTASRIAVTTIIDHASESHEGDSPAEVLKTAIMRANDAIMDAAENDPDLTGMGTTVTAMIVNDDCATVSYLGDSRIYQLRGREKVFRTFDHSYVFQSVKIGLITEEQARLSSQSNIILKALGISREIDVEVFELPYLKGDRFVLCTDGFWGAMPEKELISKIARGPVVKVLDVASLHIDMLGVRKGGHHDNLTAAMFDVTKDSKRKQKMSNKVKLLIASLALALIVSISFNIYQAVKCEKTADMPKNEVEQSDVNADDQGDTDSKEVMSDDENITK